MSELGLSLPFQVGLREQDCNQISHNDFNCSAQRFTGITLEPHQSTVLISALCMHPPRQIDFMSVWRRLVEIAKNYRLLAVFSAEVFLLSLSPTDTMLLFLVGVSTAVNNSAHENQTTGKQQAIFIYLFDRVQNNNF